MPNTCWVMTSIPPTTRSCRLQPTKLAEQKPLVQQHVMDEIYDLMINEEAYIAPYYAGDYVQMMQSNDALAFYRPEHQGFNFFIDAMCIPSCCQNQEAAELFINFLCDPEIMGANMDWIGYGAPSSEAKAYLDPSIASNEAAYPSADVLKKGNHVPASAPADHPADGRSCGSKQRRTELFQM